MLALAVCVLGLAGVNAAVVLLAQSDRRGHEAAVRLALGASRGQVVREALGESVLIAIAGLALAAAIARWASALLVAIIATPGSGVVLDVSMGPRLLAAALGLALVTGVGFGAGPALHLVAAAPHALRARSRGVVAGGRLGPGNALVGVQVALAFVLVWGATLFGRSLVELTTQPLGFDPSRVLVGTVDLRRTGVAAEHRRGRFEQLHKAVATAPGVEAAALAFLTPVSGSTWNVRVAAAAGRVFDAPPEASFNGVTDGYFRAMDTPLLSGRVFGPADTATAPRVVVVSQALARRHFGDRDPIGQPIAIAAGAGSRQMQIVGVVADAKYRSLHEPPEPTIFGALDQEPRLPPSSLRLVVRTSATGPGATRPVLEAIAGVDPDVAVSLQPFQQDVDGATTQDRLLATLAALFGAVALLLAAIGLYGVLSHAVARRTSEIGVRMALGAEPGRVRRQVLRQVAAVTAGGLALGAVAAAAASRAIGSLLFGLVPSDAGVALSSALILAAVAVGSSYVPARRASQVDPAVALRE